MITLTQAKNGQSIEIHTGDVISIQLAENPTTGYRWKENPEHPDVLKLTSSEYVRNAGGGLGRGGHHIFKYTALKAGAVSLNFKHWREWEGDSSSIAFFTANVKVIG